jgi:soluble lytic murein transglycosylase-like protein
MPYSHTKLSLPAFPLAALAERIVSGGFAVVGLTLAAVLAAALSMPQPTQAQVVPTFDGRGKVVYTNDDSPSRRTGGTISSPSGASKAKLVSHAAAASDPRLDSIVREAAERNKLDPALVKAVINTESGWNPHAISRKGAVGLMQLIPSTAQRYGVGNSMDPAQNVEGGSRYLRSLLDRYDGDLTKSLAAYNAGERAVDLSNGVPAYAETQKYVQKVTDAYFEPNSGRDFSLWSAPRPLVRREVESSGRLVFTNQ